MELAAPRDKMRLYEFEPDPLVTQIVTVTDQLKDDLENNKLDPPPEEWTVDDLLEYFQKYDIILDLKQDLFNMIQKPPLNDVISNIQGDKVIFKGHEPSEAPDVGSTTPEDQKKVVAQMAKRAIK